MRRMYSKNQIENLSKDIIEGAESGTLNSVLGLDNEGALVKGTNVAGKFTANEIIENMSGYTFAIGDNAKTTYTYYYAGAVKNGNKITFVDFLEFSLNSDFTGSGINIGTFGIPSSIGDKLFPVTIGGAPFLTFNSVAIIKKSSAEIITKAFYIQKQSASALRVGLNVDTLSLETDYIARVECTFLLSDSLVPEE